MKLSRFLRRRDTVTLACACNEQYAKGAAVTMRSLLERLDPSVRAEIWVLENRLTEETKAKLRASWDDGRTRVRFVTPDATRIAGLKLTQGMQREAYFRLLSPDLIPRKKLLYLDSDMLVLGDVLPLWRTPLGGLPMAAVPDVLLSTSLSAIPHHERLGLDPAAPYCSSALLLMDLDAWRRERIGERVIACVREHPDMIRWWDQDGLNIVLAGRWKPLDPGWNVYAEAARLLGWKPEDEAWAADLVARQRVVHFATRYKPWWHGCPHPKAEIWLETLDRTAWSGWRPDPSTRMPYPPEALA